MKTLISLRSDVLCPNTKGPYSLIMKEILPSGHLQWMSAGRAVNPPCH